MIKRQAVLPMANNNDIASVMVEEFVPVDSVSVMLEVAESMLTLVPPQQIDAAENLKRSMVWMAKYIAPTRSNHNAAVCLIPRLKPARIADTQSQVL